MGDTSIQWTDATWNPVTGCSKVSPGCAHCYAEKVADRFWPSQYPLIVTDGGVFARRFTDVQCHEDRLDQPLRWKKPRKVFVNSMSDLFHEDVPDAFIDRVFAVMALAPRHTFQVLTKRAERMRDYLAGSAMGVGENRRGRVIGIAWEMLGHPPLHKYEHGGIASRPWPLPNVWLGVSVENQHFADERIPLLLQTPAAVRFISAEPLLGPVDLEEFLFGRKWQESERELHAYLSWVIVGGESGAGARPFDIAWARHIVAQCEHLNTPVFVKQLGAAPWVKTLNHYGPGVDAKPYNVRYQLKDRKGGDMAEWPEDLRVRQFPPSSVTKDPE